MDLTLRAIRSCLSSKNWYGALFIALAAPDMCGFLENPRSKSRTRYDIWFNRYMAEKYPNRFLSGADFYALRCAILHEGRATILEQSARKALERFHFVEPRGKIVAHCNRKGDVLQLRVDIFCSDILDGIEGWIADTKDNSDVQARLRNCVRIYDSYRF